MANLPGPLMTSGVLELVSNPWLAGGSFNCQVRWLYSFVLAEGIAEDLRSALEQIEDVLGDLRKRAKH